MTGQTTVLFQIYYWWEYLPYCKIRICKAVVLISLKLFPVKMCTIMCYAIITHLNCKARSQDISIGKVSGVHLFISNTSIKFSTCMCRNIYTSLVHRRQNINTNTYSSAVLLTVFRMACTLLGGHRSSYETYSSWSQQMLEQFFLGQLTKETELC